MALKIQFVAPLIRAAIATLQDDLPGQIAVFNAEAANAIDLAIPTDENIVFGAQDPLGVKGFPVIEVSAANGRGGGSSTGLGQAGSELDHYPSLNVVVWHEGDRGEVGTTYEMSLGLARCALECLLPEGALGGEWQVAEDAAGPLFFWRTDAVPADLTPDRRDFRKWNVPVLLQLAVAGVEIFEQA